jgi:hypothetical protein
MIAGLAALIRKDARPEGQTPGVYIEQDFK